MLGYPTESQKGKFIAIFWSIFNLGGVVGASVSLGQNFHSEVSFVVSRLLFFILLYLAIPRVSHFSFDSLWVTVDVLVDVHFPL
jgi:hypothetical protein